MLILKLVGDMISQRFGFGKYQISKGLTFSSSLSLSIINDPRTKTQWYSSEQFPFWFSRLHKMTESLKHKNNSEPLQKS